MDLTTTAMMRYRCIILFLCAFSTSTQLSIGKQSPLAGNHHLQHLLADDHDFIDLAEMVTSDDQDFDVELLNEFGYASGVENIQPAGILDEIFDGDNSFYPEGDDYEGDPFVLPKSFLALLFEGSSSLEKSWTSDYDSGWNTTSIEDSNAFEQEQVSYSNGGSGLGMGKTTTTYVKHETSSQLPITVAEELGWEFMETTAHDESTGSIPLPLTSEFTSIDQSTTAHDESTGSRTLPLTTGFTSVEQTTTAHDDSTGSRSLSLTNGFTSVEQTTTVHDENTGSRTVPLTNGFTSVDQTTIAHDESTGSRRLPLTNGFTSVDQVTTAYGESTSSRTLPLTAGLSMDQTTRVHDYIESWSSPSDEQGGEFFFDDWATSAPRKESTEDRSYEEENSPNPSNENGNYLPQNDHTYNSSQPLVYSSQDLQTTSAINRIKAILEDQEKLRQDGDSEDWEPKGKSLYSRQDDNYLVDRCLAPPYPCLEGETCDSLSGKVICTPAQAQPRAAQAHAQARTCNPSPCTNGGVCRNEGGIVRCGCPTGFSGLRCEFASPCSPSPCHNNCECVESCRHELGYVCRSNGRFTGKNCTIPVPSVSCEPSRMIVDLPSELIQKFDRDTGNTVVYASPQALSSMERSPQCHASRMATNLKVIIPLPFDECGTQSDQAMGGNGGPLFRNRIWLNRRGVGYDMPVPLLEFECLYERQYHIVSSLNPVFNSPQLLGKKGKFSIDVQLCKVPGCPDQCPPQYVVNHGAVYTVGEIIHLIVSSSPMQDVSGNVISVKNLLISCDPELESDAFHLIRDGCQKPPEMFVKSRAGPRACVSLQTPRAQSCEKMYLHIHASLCKPHEIKTCPSSGLQTCAKWTKRRKRSISRGEMFSVIGPVMFLNGSRGEWKLRLYPGADLSPATTTTNGGQREDRENRPKESYKDLTHETGTSVYHLAVLVVFTVSMIILFVIAVKFSLCGLRRFYSLDNVT